MKLTDEQNAAFMRHMVDEQHCYIDDCGNGQFIIDGVIDLPKALTAIFADVKPLGWVTTGAVKESSEYTFGMFAYKQQEDTPIAIYAALSAQVQDVAEGKGEPATVHECPAYAFPNAPKKI